MMNEDFLERDKLQDLGRWHVTRFVNNVAYILPRVCLILDAGVSECVDKTYFSHREYKAIDLAFGENRRNYENIYYIGGLNEMPNKDEIFDALLCTQVFEHLESSKGLSISPSSGLRSNKPNILTIGVLQCRLILVLVVTSFQFKFLWLDKFNHSNDDIFGWTCEVQKC